MKYIAKLLLNDMRHISRDITLVFVLLLPVPLFAFLRYGVPALTLLFPALPAYHATILAFACLLISIMPAFLIAFLMLDEKDEQVWQVLQVLPLSPATFLAYRLGLIMTAGFLFSLLTILLTPLIRVTVIQAVPLALMSAAGAPLTVLAVVAFADNKIEGITIFKIVNMLLFLPALSIFLPDGWHYITGVIPVYWTYRLFAATTEPGSFMVFLSVDLVAHLLCFLLVYNVFRSRAYRRIAG